MGGIKIATFGLIAVTAVMGGMINPIPIGAVTTEQTVQPVGTGSLAVRALTPGSACRPAGKTVNNAGFQRLKCKRVGKKLVWRKVLSPFRPGAVCKPKGRTINTTDFRKLRCTKVGRKLVWKIVPTAQTVAFTSPAPVGATVGGPTYTPTASATSGLPVTFGVDGSAASVCSISSGVVTLTGVGICVVTANQAGNPSYLAATRVLQTFTVGTRLCAHGGVCAIGDTGPGGGTVFYVDAGSPAWGKYLEAAPANWNLSGSDPMLAWAPNSGPCFSADVNAQLIVLGTGETNTTNIVNDPNCNNATKAPAAWAARSYSGGGKTDWSLPSKWELGQLYAQRLKVPGLDTSSSGTQYYWSSSQHSGGGIGATIVDGQAFSNGVPAGYLKSSLLRVRPVRAF